MIEGPKTFWEDQRAGGLKKRLQCQNLRIFLQFLLSTVRGRKLISRSWAGKEKIFRFGSFLPKKGPTLDPTFRYAMLFGPLDFLNWLPNLLKMEKWCQPSMMCCWCWLMVVYVMGGWKRRHISVLSISEGGQSMLSQLKILFVFFMKPLMRIGLFHDPEKDTPRVQSL